jgi:hypothetical protein
MTSCYPFTPSTTQFRGPLGPPTDPCRHRQPPFLKGKNWLRSFGCGHCNRRLRSEPVGSERKKRSEMLVERLSSGTGRCNDSAPCRLNFAVRMGSPDRQAVRLRLPSNTPLTPVSPRIELENILMSALSSLPIANRGLPSPLQRHRDRVHRSGITVAERLDRVFQRPATRRVPQRTPLRFPVRGPSAHRGLENRLQHEPSTQCARLAQPQRVRPSMDQPTPTPTHIAA